MKSLSVLLVVEKVVVSSIETGSITCVLVSYGHAAILDRVPSLVEDLSSYAPSLGLFLLRESFRSQNCTPRPYRSKEFLLRTARYSPRLFISNFASGCVTKRSIRAIVTGFVNLPHRSRASIIIMSSPASSQSNPVVPPTQYFDHMT